MKSKVILIKCYTQIKQNMPDATTPTHDKDNDPAKLQGTAGSLSSNMEAPLPPALSACNNNNISLSSNIATVQSAPNRIVNWNELKGLIDKNLGPCSICKCAVRYLVEQIPICYASPIAIHCPVCEESKTQNYNTVHYRTKKLRKMRRITAKEKKEYRKAQLALNHEQRQLKQKSAIRASSSLNAGKDMGETPDHAFNFDVNIRAALAAFYTGTGGYDIGSVASFFGIPGGRSWERTFHRRSALVHDKIMKISADVMKKAFNEEVVATIKAELSEKYTDSEID